MSRRRVGAWEWVTLAETPRHVRTTVDMLGIVVEAGVPYKSRGPDYCVTLKIIDDSGTDRELSVNVFNRSINILPRLRGHLDVILLHNVRIGIHDQSPCVSWLKASCFALFDGRDVADCEPYQLSPGLQGLQSAEKYVRKLRLWSSMTRFDAGISDYALPLADIDKLDFFDLVCKVLHVSEASAGNWMLFVWDGTDAPPLSLSTELTEEWNSLPLHIEPFCLPEDVLHKFPRVGTVLRVLIDDKYETFGFHFQHEEKWVRLRNLMCKSESGLWKGIFTLETKFRLLSEQDNSVKDRLRFCNERLSEQGGVPSAANPRLDLLTVMGNEEADFATLLDLLCSSLPQGGYKKCIVRVVAAYPLQAKDFGTSAGLYRLRLTLEDPTARIHAYLSHEDAVFLFGGDLGDDIILNKLNKLLGVDEFEVKSTKNPPWVQCCIGFNSSGASKRFHMCKTAFAV